MKATTTRRVFRFAAILALAVALPAMAQDAPPATQPGQDGQMPDRLMPAEGAEPAWTVFSSPEAGIELKVPPGARQVSEDPNTLELVVNPDRGWRFELRRVPLERPMELAPVELPEGGRRTGLLELLARDEHQKTQGDLLRQDLTPLGDADAGIYALRYSMGLTTQLKQVALIRASETLYYQVSLISPAPTGPVEELARNEDVAAAVEAFNTVINSFHVLDQTALRQEQEDRLLRTRTLFVNFTKPRLMETLKPEQWWRIRRNGQDIGYSYVVEEPARQVPANPVDRERIDIHGARGVRVGIRTRLRRDGAWLDRETWLFATDDLREGDFRERNQLTAGEEKQAENLVVGTMRARQVPRSVTVPGPGGIGSERGFTVVDARRLEVTFVVNGVQTGAPLTRQLPAWYLPQAINHLLPRLVAPWGRNTYLVAVYNPEKREIYQQYVDVEGPLTQQVQGEQRVVMVVSTRMGLSGPPTRHFIDPNTYEWLGSVNEEDGLEIWPADAETLRQIWEDPDLSAPDARQREGN